MNVDGKPYWLRGRMLGGGITALAGKSPAALDAEAVKRHFEHWAVYREGPHFHSTTQREFLVCHHGDPYWLVQGVPSGHNVVSLV